MVGAEGDAVGHEQAAGQEQPAGHHAGQAESRGQGGQRHQGNADIVGQALLQAELAGDVAAEMLEAERGADHRGHRQRKKGGGAGLAATGRGGQRDHGRESVRMWVAGSVEVSDGEIEQNEGGGAEPGQQAQALLDEMADRLAIAS